MDPMVMLTLEQVNGLLGKCDELLMVGVEGELKRITVRKGERTVCAWWAAPDRQWIVTEYNRVTGDWEDTDVL